MNRIKKIKGIFLLLSMFSFSSLFSADYAENSVLSSGKWIQLQVNENAIYKLTYDEIKKMGINDPSKVKLFGYGAWILDEDFTKPYIDDLPEVSVWLNKGSDNVFNSGDYLLFYGRGTTKWTYNTRNSFFEHENNPYSTFSSYFLTESDTGPKEMSSMSYETDTSQPWSGTDVTIFDDYIFHEKDSIAIIRTGRELFGESFVGRNSRDFSFTVPGITADPGKARLSFVANPKETVPVSLSIDGKSILTLNISKLTGDYRRANMVNGIATWDGEKKEQIIATVSYNSSGQTIANLNYISLNIKRQLRFYDNYTFFRNTESLQKDVKYIVANAGSQSQIWDVTDNFNVGMVSTTQEGNNLSFRAEKSTVLREYVMVDYSKTFPTPQVIGEVKNQNLHNLPQTDMVIIVPEVYFSQAEKLAERHRSNGLRVVTVQPEWIYNEFSSGTRDATAYRRFMKMFYDRAASNEEEKPKYLLLFGDGIFDNRHLTSDASKMDPNYYLLTFQVLDSVDETNSYGTDDYFGFLDDNEGTRISSDGLDLGIGRFPVRTLAQAENAVLKVLSYMDDNIYKEWKNRVIFTADNTDNTRPNSFCTHALQADTISQYIENNHPEYIITKSYMDAFKTVDVNGKNTIPDAKNKLLTSLKEGCFILNYTGHGSTTSWSAEDMLRVADIRKMNFEGLPLWITATCDFGWFDRIDTSAGEEAFLNKNSGAIALFTTSRVVFSDNNARLHSRLIRNIFSKENGKHLRLGDILRRSKNGMKSDSNKLNYVLLGDPALELNYPNPNLAVQIEKINGETIDKDKVYSFRALDRIELEGKIVDENGVAVTDFNGRIKTNVFDSRQQVNSIQVNDSQNHFSFFDYLNVVYIGNNEVKDGQFSVSFNVPLDISYGKDNGKMNFYAYDENTGLDASGYYSKYRLAGTADDSDFSDEGPEILSMFLNSESFKDGDTVNETPYFVARVFDEEGINMTGSGLGHDIIICINNSATLTYPLNSYYTPIGENEGEIKFSIPALPPGKHQLVFKVWDILNNSSTDSLTFNVVAGLKPHLYDVTATDIPARDNTKFLLTHDRPESEIEVEISVYDLAGRIVWTHKEAGSSSWLKQYPIEWRLTDNTGRRVGMGVYLYRAIISTPEGKEATKSKKIIVLEQ